jgi:hypothetical protein
MIGPRVAGGSTSVPSYSFSADTNTGIYSSAADTLDFTVGGNTRMTIGGTVNLSGVPIVSNQYILTSSEYYMRGSSLCFKVGASDRAFFCTYAPTIASGFGTSPTIAGIASSFTVTVGTGGVATTGIVNFGVTYNVAPRCIAQNQTTEMDVRATPTTTQVTLTSGSAWTAADKIDVICLGGS